MPAAEREAGAAGQAGDVPTSPRCWRRIAAVQAEVEAALENGRTPLPERPDLDAVSAWSVSAHQRHWAAAQS
jgi:hypothetical protein